MTVGDDAQVSKPAPGRDEGRRSGQAGGAFGSIGDIHNQWRDLDKAFDLWQAENIDATMFVGDLTNKPPQASTPASKEVLDRRVDETVTARTTSRWWRPWATTTSVGHDRLRPVHPGRPADSAQRRLRRSTATTSSRSRPVPARSTRRPAGPPRADRATTLTRALAPTAPGADTAENPDRRCS